MAWYNSRRHPRATVLGADVTDTQQLHAHEHSRTRVRGDGIARLMYVAKFHDTVCVLHVFTKKSQKTTKTDIDIAEKRYREARDG